MVKEQLSCQLCSTVWFRDRARGRKPRFCPTCLQNAIVVNTPAVHARNEDIAKQKRNNKRQWICPSCSMEITTYVNLSQPPGCTNPLAHTSRYVEMISYDRKEEEIVSYA